MYYTAYLSKSADGTMTGKAVENTLIDKPEANHAVSYLITLKRLEN
jgi:hypothetical protein